MIKNVNTIEEYRSLDKGAILSQAARTVRQRSIQKLPLEWLPLTVDEDMGGDP